MGTVVVLFGGKGICFLVTQGSFRRLVVRIFDGVPPVDGDAVNYAMLFESGVFSVSKVTIGHIWIEPAGGGLIVAQPCLVFLDCNPVGAVVDILRLKGKVPVNWWSRGRSDIKALLSILPDRS